MTETEVNANQAGKQAISWVSRSNCSLLLVYLFLLTGGLIGLWTLRRWAIETYDTSDAQQNWSAWQDETERQSEGDGPVVRRKAKSEEPPALVLARDYFAVLTAIFTLLGTVLFATIAVLLRGALSSTPKIHDDPG